MESTAARRSYCCTIVTTRIRPIAGFQYSAKVEGESFGEYLIGTHNIAALAVPVELDRLAYGVTRREAELKCIEMCNEWAKINDADLSFL